jgi:hypothetical protein
MTVVVNEFEVVPAVEHPEPDSPRDAAADGATFDVERDVRRVLEFQRARAARLHAC